MPSLGDSYRYTARSRAEYSTMQRRYLCKLRQLGLALFVVTHYRGANWRGHSYTRRIPGASVQMVVPSHPLAESKSKQANSHLVLPGQQCASVDFGAANYGVLRAWAALNMHPAERTVG